MFGDMGNTFSGMSTVERTNAHALAGGVNRVVTSGVRDARDRRGRERARAVSPVHDQPEDGLQVAPPGSPTRGRGGGGPLAPPPPLPDPHGAGTRTGGARRARRAPRVGRPEDSRGPLGAGPPDAAESQYDDGDPQAPRADRARGGPAAHGLAALRARRPEPALADGLQRPLRAPRRPLSPADRARRPPARRRGAVGLR